MNGNTAAEESPRNIDLLVLAPQFPPAYLGGGPARTMEAMILQCSEPWRVGVVTSDTDHGAAEPMDVERNQWSTRNGAHVWYGSLDSPYQIMRSLVAARRARPANVYLNSMFHPYLSLLPLLLRRVGFWRGSSFVVAPRGEADEGALRLKSMKKALFLTVARSLGLYRGVLWHASSEREAESIRELGYQDAVVLVKENETLLPIKAASAKRPAGSTARLLYVGRVSRKKQLELVLQALHHVRGEYILTVVGDCDDPVYEHELLQIAAPLEDRVVWHGSAPREKVFALLDESILACFPTAGENFGHVIAEALSRSCPVMIMDVTPWTSLIASGGGVLVNEPTPDAWALALNEVISTPETWLGRRAAAGAAYEGWRGLVDGRSFLDYLLTGDHRLLVRGA